MCHTSSRLNLPLLSRKLKHHRTTTTAINAPYVPRPATYPQAIQAIIPSGAVRQDISRIRPPRRRATSLETFPTALTSIPISDNTLVHVEVTINIRRLRAVDGFMRQRTEIALAAPQLRQQFNPATTVSMLDGCPDFSLTAAPNASSQFVDINVSFETSGQVLSSCHTR